MGLAHLADLRPVCRENRPGIFQGMPINIALYPGAFAAGDFSPIDAVLEGLLLRPGKISESLMASVQITVVQENLEDVETGPFLLMEGFVDFAKKLHARFPDFVFFASTNNRFYLDFLIALSGDVSAVQTGSEGRLLVGDPIKFFDTVRSEVAHFEQFCAARCDCSEQVRGIHAAELTEYLSIVPV